MEKTHYNILTVTSSIIRLTQAKEFHAESHTYYARFYSLQPVKKGTSEPKKIVISVSILNQNPAIYLPGGSHPIESIQLIS